MRGAAAAPGYETVAPGRWSQGLDSNQRYTVLQTVALTSLATLGSIGKDTQADARGPGPGPGRLPPHRCGLPLRSSRPAEAASVRLSSTSTTGTPWASSSEAAIEARKPASQWTQRGP